MRELLKKCLVEFIGAFFLIFTIGCSCFPNGRGAFPPLAIGSVLLVALLATIGTCYGAFNPAVALGLILMGLAQIKLTLWTVLANFLAGAAAAGIYKITEAE